MKFENGYLQFTDKSAYSFKTGKHDIDANIHTNLSVKRKKPYKIYQLEVEVKADKGAYKSAYLRFLYDFQEGERVFLNGFQSWTKTVEKPIGGTMGKLRFFVKPIMRQYGDYTFSHSKGKKGEEHGWTYAYIRREDGSILFFGSLNESNGYTEFIFQTLEGYIEIHKEVEGLNAKGKRHLLHFFMMEGEEEEVFERFYHVMGLKEKKTMPALGWTSWYNHYTNISERIIKENLKAFLKHQVPIDIFQIDDGWQEKIGDWLEVKDSFPSGMEKVSAYIRKKQIYAGLWLAPFICEKQSKLFKEHPDWLLRDARGKPVTVGYNPLWSGWFYGVDIYHPEVRDYLKKVFHQVLVKWRFNMVKLDFLYAAAYIPRNGKTRGEIMQDAMNFLRECCGDKLILGCGVPLASAFDTADYCRIGCDISLGWDNWVPKLTNFREFVSTHQSLGATISRWRLNGKVFWNDPDVFNLRENNNKLTPTQRYTLMVTNLLFGGLVFTSDNIAEYDVETLGLYLSIFPHKQKEILSLIESDGCYQVRAKVKEREYFVLINLSSKARKAKLPPYKYSAYNGEGKPIQYATSSKIDLEPYESRIFLRIPYEPFQIIADNIHLFPASEVQTLAVNKDHIRVSFHRNTRAKGELWIRVQGSRKSYWVNGKQYKVEKLWGEDAVRVPRK